MPSALQMLLMGLTATPAATANLGEAGGTWASWQMRSRARTGHRGKGAEPGEAAIQGDASAAELTPADSSTLLCPTPHKQHLFQLTRVASNFIPLNHLYYCT